MVCECSECLEPILYPTAKYCPSCGVSYLIPSEASGASADDYAGK